MNPPDPEDILRRLQPRPLPPEWKRAVLDAAESRRNAPAWPMLQRIERTVWGAIAAAWVIIAALHGTTPEISRPPGPAPDPAATAEYWRRVRRFAATGEFPPEPARIHLGETLILKPRS